MRYEHAFTIDAPLQKVRQFHQRPGSLAAITPPPMRVETNATSGELREGDVVAFTLKLGPLPLMWEARIESMAQDGFTDRLVRGPFKRWIHRHNFRPLGENTTRVADDIEFELRPHPLWGPIGALMTLGMPALFRYRAWKTRRILQADRSHPTPDLSISTR